MNEMVYLSTDIISYHTVTHPCRNQAQFDWLRPVN